MHLSIEFQEAYKKLDRLCKDCLSSNEGVSEYIRQMENTSWKDKQLVPSWDDDYKMLKHVRWIRNQFAHEIGTLDSDICTIDDLNYIKDFYDRILNGNDPITLIRKAKKSQQGKPKAKKTKNSLEVLKIVVPIITVVVMSAILILCRVFFGRLIGVLMSICVLVSCRQINVQQAEADEFKIGIFGCITALVALIIYALGFIVSFVSDCSSFAYGMLIPYML